MIRIGIVGCGNISDIYLQNLTNRFQNAAIYALSDLDPKKAENAAKKYKIARIMTLDEMLVCPEIDLILNLTTPQGHYPINRRCLLAGKSVYCEKPLSLTYAQGKELVELAAEHKLWLGCAPDTFLGAGIQTGCDLVQSGKIGRPVSAMEFMLCHGHEHWHPDPEFYYAPGGGPLFDMGPYYLTALVQLLGEAESVYAMNGRAFAQRIITSEPKNGKIIDVQVDTHNAALIRFRNGAVATLITSFDVWRSTLPHMELHGTDGSLRIPDPNNFDGPVYLSNHGQEWVEIELVNEFRENSRGLGVSRMVQAMTDGCADHPANGLQGLHVLEIMEAIVRSGQEHREISLESRLTH